MNTKNQEPELNLKAKSLPSEAMQQSRQHRKPIAIKINKHIGQRVCFRRKIFKMSQVDLGVKLGVSGQQIQKYEKGTNRIASSMLYKISKILSVPISYFYDGVDECTIDDVEGA